MAGRIIACVGRRRLTVSKEKDNTTITIWLRDPPRGHKIAGLELDKVELQKLIAELTELISTT